MTRVVKYAAITAAIGLLSSLIGLFLAPWADGIAFDFLYRFKGSQFAGQGAETATPVSVIVIDEETMNASEGEIVKISANKPHSLRATRRFKMILLMIRS